MFVNICVQLQSYSAPKGYPNPVRTSSENHPLDNHMYLHNLTRENDREVTREDIIKICGEVKNWRRTAKYLGLSDVDISRLYHDYNTETAYERAFQTLYLWLQRRRTNPTFSNLISMLREAGESSAIKSAVAVISKERSEWFCQGYDWYFYTIYCLAFAMNASLFIQQHNYKSQEWLGQREQKQPKADNYHRLAS